jgi:hypothetical protein
MVTTSMAGGVTMSKSVGRSRFGPEQETLAKQAAGPDLGLDDAVALDLGRADAAESDPSWVGRAL